MRLSKQKTAWTRAVQEGFMDKGKLRLTSDSRLFRQRELYDII